MYALGTTTAFHPDLGPKYLAEVAAQLRGSSADDEVSDWFDDFAHDLATIRNLPETKP